MTRVDDLQKKYPSIPRDVILKHDVLVEGVRDGEELDWVSGWSPGQYNYQSFDYDVTLQEISKKAPWRVKPGFIVRPLSMRFKSGLGAPPDASSYSEVRHALWRTTNNESIRPPDVLSPRPAGRGLDTMDCDPSYLDRLRRPAPASILNCGRSAGRRNP